MNFTKNINNLLLIYLVLPLILFLLFWVKLGIALPVSIITLYAIKFEYISELKIKLSVKLVVFSIIICSLGGVGGYVFQSGDYEKHNQIFHDIIVKPSPTIYSNGDFLCYYLAYYITPSIFSKIVGIENARLISFLYTIIGVFLVFTSMSNQFKTKNPLLFSLIFVFMSGLDIIKILFDINFITQYKTLLINILHLEVSKNELFLFLKSFLLRMNDTRIFFSDFNFSHGVLFVSQIGQFTLAPQHLLGAWISTLLIYSYIKERNLPKAILVICVTLFWSPFVFIGLIPYVLYLLFIIKKEISLSLILKCLLPLPLFFILILYFGSHYPDLSHLEFLIAFFQNPVDFVKLLFFLFVEIGIYYIMVQYFSSKYDLPKEMKKLLNISFISLIIISSFNMGIFNDFIIRASLPSLIILYSTTLYVFFNLFQRNPPRRIKFIIITMLTIACLEGISMCFTHYFNKDKIPQSSIIAPNFTDITKVTYEFYGNHIDISKQYLGQEKSLFYKYLLKNSSDK